MTTKLEELLKLLAATQAAASDLQEELQADAQFRAQIIKASKRLTQTLQTPIDRAFDVYVQSVAPAVLQVAIDAGWIALINVLDTTSSSDGDISADQLATATSSDVELVKRLMRVLTSEGFVHETGTNRYAPTSISKFFGKSQFADGLRHTTRDYSITMAGMPGYFKEHGYRLPGVSDGVYPYVHGQTFFERVHQGGEIGQQFNNFMGAARGGKTPWFEGYPVVEKLQVKSDADVLLVDVGGGKGHDLLAFAERRKALGLSGKLVLQDQAAAIAQVPSEGRGEIETQEHDFFTEEPVRGARSYLLKHVLHDWPDKDCVSILRNLRDAMEVGYSKLLIDDIVLPDRECGAWAAAFDVAMLAAVGGKERLASEWEAIINEVGGLKIEKFWLCGPVDGESVIEVVKLP